MAFIGPVSAGDNPVFVRNDVELQISKQSIGPGELIITESAFIWRPEARPDGVTVPWTNVSLHAIESEPRCIYLQLDFSLKWQGVYEGNGHMASDEDNDEGNASDCSDTPEMTELRIIPTNDQDIHQIFYAMNHCQALNPDPNDSPDSEQDEDMGEEEDDGEGGSGQDGEGSEEMRNLNLNGDEDQQFADN